MIKKRKYKNYEDYVHHQISKTTSKRSQEREAKEFVVNTARFRVMFASTFERYSLSPTEAVCAGSRAGAEVKALQELGVDAIGYDLVAHEPYTLQGDMHNLPIEDGSVDLVFTNAFDHVLYPQIFARNIRRVMQPGGVLIAHLAIGASGDKYKALELYAIEDFLSLFDGELLGVDPLEWRGALNRAVMLRL